MKYFSMFSGIGGFELGIEQAYKEAVQRRGLKDSLPRRGVPSTGGGDFWWWGHEQSPLCVGYAEIDKYATAIYDYHFKHKNYGDCTKINWQEVKDFDLLAAGFPCQSFSVAGKGLGFEDTRGTLFFEIARCLKEKQPKYFILENVKGLLSNKSGRTFKTIVSTLTELGYDIQWQCLNSKCFGVPQSRPRVFIVGHLRGERRPEIFPIREGNEEDSGEGAYACALNSSDWRGANRNQKQNLVYTPIVMNTLTGATGNRAGSSKEFLKSVDNIYAATKSCRRLTPTECERLQGFDDGWTAKGIMKGKEVAISDTRRYQTLGNAVTVNVVRYVFGKMLND